MNPMPDSEPLSRHILCMRVDKTSYQDAAERVLAWARAGESRYVCIANVNSVMEAHDSRDFLRIMNEADLVTPDGMPLVWGLRMLGAREATRVYGPDLTPLVLGAAERAGVPVGFYGASPGTLERLFAVVRRRYPALEIAYAFAPPFRPLAPAEDVAVTGRIRSSGARILFVGIGAPKQERWMAAHRGRLPAVMLGVGAAFDFLAGVKPQAPLWMRDSGIEWLFRLVCEPRRLGRRYLKDNPRFAALFALQLLEQRFTT
jgi:N-acetylglucosaminyldiphosphoundecaprenol N-acetyl-beta-D-mannosaminyltransferase